MLPKHAEYQALPRPVVLIPVEAETCAAVAEGELLAGNKSAQRESNPHIRHGKATGCRYIMGAKIVAEIVNTAVQDPVGPVIRPAAGQLMNTPQRVLKHVTKRASGGTRTRVVALRKRNPGHWTTDALETVSSSGTGGT